MNAYDIIKTVRVTEKGTDQSHHYNQYTVVADTRANKFQIRDAVEELFKVSVVRVNTINVRGKKTTSAHQTGRTFRELEEGIGHVEER